jgi:hypothetical protein
MPSEMFPINNRYKFINLQVSDNNLIVIQTLPVNLHFILNAFNLETNNTNLVSINENTKNRKIF